MLLTGQCLHDDLEGVGWTLPSWAPLETPRDTDSLCESHALNGSLDGSLDSSGNLCRDSVSEDISPTEILFASGKYVGEASRKWLVS